MPTSHSGKTPEKSTEEWQDGSRRSKTITSLSNTYQANYMQPQICSHALQELTKANWITKT